ncbi:MAG: HDOD domain-containing protein [Methylobacter sp.]
MPFNTSFKNIESLYSLPDVAKRANELLKCDHVPHYLLADVIMHDPALTTKLLSHVNSAGGGMGAPIDKVSSAVLAIGAQGARRLLEETAPTSSFSGIPFDLVDMDTFWCHSVMCGVLARLLAEQCNHGDSERFFVAGLLRSIGKLVMFSHCPEKAQLILSHKDQGEDAVVDAEKRVFGYTHTELGAELLKEWQLPRSIWRLVGTQLNPGSAEVYCEDICIMHVAARIADSIEPCSVKTDMFLNSAPVFDPKVLQLLGLSEVSIKSMVLDAYLQVFDILGFIKPESTMIF